MKMITKTTTTKKCIIIGIKFKSSYFGKKELFGRFGRVDHRNHIRPRKQEAFGTINSKKIHTSDWMRTFVLKCLNLDPY